MQVSQLLISEICVGEEKHVRSRLDSNTLDGLSGCIDDVGVLQPILVMKSEEGYLLVAGARRLAACKQLGHPTIPALVLSEDSCVRQIQLIENLQREDLNPLDKAVAVRMYMSEDKLSKTAVAKKLGIPRTTLNDWLDILTVDSRYQDAVLNNYYGGSSPLTLSHITLAKRYAMKKNSDKLVNVVLDSVLYYALNRTETKKVLELVGSATDLSIEDAIRKLRLIPKDAPKQEGNEEWDVDKLVSFLAKSGDYLVKTELTKLNELEGEQRQELLRQSRVLSSLLAEVIASLPDGKVDKRSLTKIS